MNYQNENKNPYNYGTAQPTANMYYQQNNVHKDEEILLRTNDQDNKNFQYPVTNMNVDDADQQNGSEFVLSENVKLLMMLATICCLLLFFIVLLVK